MMPDLFIGWHALVLALSLGGFALLALAREREGRLLLGRGASAQQRRAFRLLGWPLLALAWAVCVWGWFGHFGTVLWFGWLTMAATALVFAIAYWPWRKQGGRQADGGGAAAANRLPDVAPPPARGWRGLWLLLLVGFPLGFGWQLHQAPPHPLLRSDAVTGQAGPWRFVIAEEEREAPEISAIGVPVKHFMLRFCDECELQIAQAWLQIRQPYSLQAAGMRLQREGRNREAMLAIPPAAWAEDGLWLTVRSRSGEVYQTAFDIRRLSPATAGFLAARGGSQEVAP